jgi:hypothetical protein
VGLYRPASEGEVFDIMNALEDRMAQVNSALVMAAVKVFLHLTLAMPATHQQVGAATGAGGAAGAGAGAGSELSSLPSCHDGSSRGAPACHSCMPLLPTRTTRLEACPYPGMQPLAPCPPLSLPVPPCHLALSAPHRHPTGTPQAPHRHFHCSKTFIQAPPHPFTWHLLLRCSFPLLLVTACWLSPPQVLERIKDPLKTLISRDEPATVYAVLAHVLLIVQRAPFIFEQDHVSFYCRWAGATLAGVLQAELAGCHVLAWRRLC